MKLLIIALALLGMTGCAINNKPNLIRNTIKYDDIHRINNSVETNDRLRNMEDTLDKMYSLIADLHIKYMGIDRYEQIAFPNDYLKRKEWRDKQK
ncbi:MAG: hypothetical protein WC810_03115 [Janthinobacterium sp.]|jgi:hypothetical protein